MRRATPPSWTRRLGDHLRRDEVVGGTVHRMTIGRAVFVGLLHVASLVGCVAPLPTGEVGEALTGELDGLVDRGSGPCVGPLEGTCRHFELYSTTPHAFVALDGQQLDVVGYCDGRVYSAAGQGLTITCSPTLGNCGEQQLNVQLVHSGDGWPDRACFFQLQQSLTSALVVGDNAFVEPSYGARVGPVAAIRVAAASDVGVVAATQRLALVGDFPGLTSPAAYRAAVSCDGAVVAATMEQVSPSSATLAFAATAGARDCVAALVRQSDAARSTTIHVRLGAAPARLPTGFAGYVWSGNQRPQGSPSLVSAVTDVLEAGMRSVRLHLGPAMRLATKTGDAGGYLEQAGLDAASVLAACPASQPFLSCIAQVPGFQAALAALPVGSATSPVYVPMTVYDSTTTGPYFLNAEHLLDLGFIEAHAADIIAEYRDFTLALYQTQLGTGRTFVVTNWETESQFTVTTRDVDGRIVSITYYPHALKRWLVLRQLGIQAGRALAVAAGYAAGGLNPARVADGIEFARIRPGQLSALHHIIAGVLPWPDPWGKLCPEFALWSAWEGSNAGTLDEDIPAIRAELQQSCPATTLILGELGSGYPQNPTEPLSSRDRWHLLETARAAYRWNLPLTVLWEAYSTSVPGLLNPDGSDKPEMRALRADLTAYAAPGVAVRPPQAVQIHAIRDRGKASFWATVRNFELYGAFPGTPSTYRARYRCEDGVQHDATITYGPAGGQMNISISNPLPTAAGKERFCTFWVVTGTVRSPEVGPRGLCPVTGPMDPAPQAPCP